MRQQPMTVTKQSCGSCGYTVEFRVPMGRDREAYLMTKCGRCGGSEFQQQERAA